MKLLEKIVEKHMTIINWVGVIVASWILSMIVAELIGSFLPSQQLGPAGPSSENVLTELAGFQNKNAQHYMPICERNIFDSQKRSACEKKRAPMPTSNNTPREPAPDPDAAPVKSNINATLKGTTVFGDPNRSFATIAVNGKSETENFKVDDQIIEQTKVYKIERNIVYFTHKGRKEFLEIQDTAVADKRTPASTKPKPPATGAIKRNGNEVTLTRQKVDSLLKDMNKIIQDARMVPNYSNGVVDGFKIFAIKSGSFFQEMGLRNGDKINQINGTVVDSLEKVLPMMQLLKTESNFEVGITRRGSKEVIKINIQ